MSVCFGISDGRRGCIVGSPTILPLSVVLLYKWVGSLAALELRGCTDKNLRVVRRRNEQRQNSRAGLQQNRSGALPLSRCRAFGSENVSSRPCSVTGLFRRRCLISSPSPDFRRAGRWRWRWRRRVCVLCGGWMVWR